ncbi:MAG: sulfur oxidation c-type cytochrome SoxX [Caldimonas sp.]
MNATRIAVVATVALAACASMSDPAGTSDPAALDRLARDAIRASFRAQGIAKLDRLDQDAVQQACSSPQPPSDEIARRLEAAEQATIRWPEDGNYLGDWREGEKLAQNGRGMTWTDAPGAPSGGNCYNCHQLAKAEISFGTIGPSLYHYGRLRGVTNAADPAAATIVKYTWGKIWNSKAYSACSTMPRFGHAGVLTQAQVRDLMALLLDPKSPVNEP